MVKVGEHITLDFLGVKKDYPPSFYEKIIYTIAKAAKVDAALIPRYYLSKLDLFKPKAVFFKKGRSKYGKT